MAGHGAVWDGVRWVARTAVPIAASYLTGGVPGAGIAAAQAITRNLSTRSNSTASQGLMFEPGADMNVVSEAEARALGMDMTGMYGVNGRRRRRRRKLLTCGDKNDIAFLRGTLGGGQLGQAAISALLSRRCS